MGIMSCPLRESPCFHSICTLIHNSYIKNGRVSTKFWVVGGDGGEGKKGGEGGVSLWCWGYFVAGDFVFVFLFFFFFCFFLFFFFFFVFFCFFFVFFLFFFVFFCFFLFFFFVFFLFFVFFPLDHDSPSQFLSFFLLTLKFLKSRTNQRMQNIIS